MKKLLAIMMALVMCCTLVVSASAEEYDGDFFWMDIDLDGYWSEYEAWEVEFDSDNGSWLSVYVYDESEVGDLENYYLEERDFCEDMYYDDDEGIYFFNEGEIDGCPAFCMDEYDGDFIYSYVLILTDNYIYEIVIEADSTEYDYIWAAVEDITVYDVYSGDDYYEDDYYEDDYEDDYVEDDYEDEEIVEEEEEEEDEKKPSKNDKNDKDDKDDKDDKKDKDDKDEDEDEEKDNTTLIIIIVAAVAVVAVAAVVIVLVTKKKN